MFRHNESSVHISHTRSMRCPLPRCRWRTEIMSNVAKSTAPRKRANMAPTQVVTMAITPTTVLTMAATTMETIMEITSMDIQSTSMVATDLLEYIASRCTCWVGFHKINACNIIVLLSSLSNCRRSRNTVLNEFSAHYDCSNHDPKDYYVHAKARSKCLVRYISSTVIETRHLQ